MAKKTEENENIIEEKITPEDNIEAMENSKQPRVNNRKSKSKVTFGLFEVIVFLMAFSIIACLLGYVIGNKIKKKVHLRQ